MDNTKTPEQITAPSKKEVRKQLADKIAAAIPELKSTLGEKKFESRIKKAVKHITEGMHKKETAKIAKKVKAVKTSAPAKKAVAGKKVKSAKSTNS